MDNFTYIAQAISKGMPTNIDWKEVFESAEELGPKYYELATAIVEPDLNDIDSEVADDYDVYVDKHSEKWANWIRQTFGENWGKIADLVNENGY